MTNERRAIIQAEEYTLTQAGWVPLAEYAKQNGITGHVKAQASKAIPKVERSTITTGQRVWVPLADLLAFLAKRQPSKRRRVSPSRWDTETGFRVYGQTTAGTWVLVKTTENRRAAVLLARRYSRRYPGHLWAAEVDSWEAYSWTLFAGGVTV